MTIKDCLVNFCEDMGYSYDDSYSGRCMYGKKCFSISCNNALETLMEVVDSLVSEGVSGFMDVLGTPRQDSFGMGQVLYFPNADLEEEVE